MFAYRNHDFDCDARRAKNPHRKSGKISEASAPGRGSTGVRNFHKVNEEFILYHRRLGYTDEEIDEMWKS